MTYTMGWDYSDPKHGMFDVMHCKACSKEMDVKKGVPGRGYGMHRSTERDVFTCSQSGEKWHDQVIALMKFQLKTPSASISLLVEKEIRDILATKTTTKESWGWAH
jgi:hypothetical protein